MRVSNGVIRNITTGVLHTNMGDVYKFIEDMVNEKGIMTHQLPAASRCLMPFLKERLDDSFFTGGYIKDVKGHTNIEPLNDAEKEEFFKAFTSAL